MTAESEQPPSLHLTPSEPTHAYIYKQNKAPKGAQPLNIDDKGIAFLIAPIMNHAEFLSSESHCEWYLTFFKGSPFPQKLIVYLFNGPTPNHADRNIIALKGKAYWRNSGGEPAENDVLTASHFLRKSKTLTDDRLKKLSSGRSIVADKDGIVYFSDAAEQFKRLVLCQALAIAYTEVMYDCIGELTEQIKSKRDAPEDTLKLYESILRFNAADYFSLPVPVSKHELFDAWTVLSEHHSLKMLNKELTQQLSAVATLWSKEQEQAQEKRDNRRAFAIGVIGVLLTAASLLSLVQITPKQFTDNFAAWAMWWDGKGSQPVPKPAARAKSGSSPARQK